MKLTAAARNALPDSAFALPAKRKYPIPDKGHAQVALGRATQNATPSEKAEIVSKVRDRFKGMMAKRKAK